MKAVHLISHFDGAVRPGKASADEIRDVLSGDSSETLAYVSLDDHGDLLVVALTPAQIEALRGELARLHLTQLRRVLDAALALMRTAAGMRGINAKENLTIWPEDAPYAEDVVRDWAAEHGLTVDDSSMPAVATKSWIRTMRVHDNDKYSPLVRLQWPAIDINPSVVVGIEVASLELASLQREVLETEEPF
jgi:hypothetical protein